MKKVKRGQIQIQEMAFMLVGVALFFTLAGLIALAFIYTNLYKTANDLAETKTFAAIVALADSPEFSCVDSKSNCVDGDKVINLIDKKDYIGFWPFSSLRVVTRYSAFSKSYDEMIICNKANYPDCDMIVIYDKKVENEIATSSFVAFCRKEYEDFGNLGGYSYDKCEIGMLIAGTEEKEVPLKK